MNPLSLVAGLVSTWLQGRQRKQEAKIERDIQIISNDAEYNHAAQVAEGWKDEYLVILLSLPYLAGFIGTLFNEPEIIARNAEFMASIAQAPEWYQWAFMGAIAASFGLKGWDRVKK